MWSFLQLLCTFGTVLGYLRDPVSQGEAMEEPPCNCAAPLRCSETGGMKELPHPHTPVLWAGEALGLVCTIVQCCASRVSQVLLSCSIPGMYLEALPEYGAEV